MTTSVKDELKAHAPHVDGSWADEFVFELRLRGASGAAIGAALLEVESHVAEQGTSVTATFGDATQYAASLELPDTQEWTMPELVRQFVKTILEIVAVFLLIGGFAALWIGGDARVPVVELIIIIAAAIAVFAILSATSGAALRGLVRHPVLGALLTGAIFVVVIVAATAIPGPVLRMAPGIAIGGGLVSLAVVAVIVAVEHRRGKKLGDPIIFPQPQ